MFPSPHHFHSLNVINLTFVEWKSASNFFLSVTSFSHLLQTAVFLTSPCFTTYKNKNTESFKIQASNFIFHQLFPPLLKLNRKKNEKSLLIQCRRFGNCGFEAFATDTGRDDEEIIYFGRRHFDTHVNSDDGRTFWKFIGSGNSESSEEIGWWQR